MRSQHIGCLIGYLEGEQSARGVPGDHGGFADLGAHELGQVPAHRDVAVSLGHVIRAAVAVAVDDEDVEVLGELGQSPQVGGPVDHLAVDQEQRRAVVRTFCIVERCAIHPCCPLDESCGGGRAAVVDPVCAVAHDVIGDRRAEARDQGGAEARGDGACGPPAGGHGDPPVSRDRRRSVGGARGDGAVARGRSRGGDAQPFDDAGSRVQVRTRATEFSCEADGPRGPGQPCDPPSPPCCAGPAAGRRLGPCLPTTPLTPPPPTPPSRPPTSSPAAARSPTVWAPPSRAACCAPSGWATMTGSSRRSASPAPGTRSPRATCRWTVSRSPRRRGCTPVAATRCSSAPSPSPTGAPWATTACITRWSLAI